MKVEIISLNDYVDLERRINEFIADKEIVNLTVTPTPMHDLYSNQEPAVCNQWVEYTAVIIYKRVAQASEDCSSSSRGANQSRPSF